MLPLNAQCYTYNLWVFAEPLPQKIQLKTLSPDPIKGREQREVRQLAELPLEVTETSGAVVKLSHEPNLQSPYNIHLLKDEAAGRKKSSAFTLA